MVQIQKNKAYSKLAMVGIVHVITFLDGPVGGMEVQALQLSHQLKRKGYNPFFITCIHASIMRRRKLTMVGWIEGFRVYRILVFKNGGILNKIMFMTGGILLLILLRKQYAVIHAHQLYTSGVVAAFAKLFLRSKKVIVKNVAGGDKYGDVAELKRLKGSRFSIACMRRTVDRFIAVSPQTAQEMKGIGLRSVRVIPNGVDIDRFHQLDSDRRAGLRNEILGMQVDKRTVLFVGRLGPEKNLFTLFNAIAMLGPEVLLYIIGDGLFRNRLHQYTQEQGIAERIIFLGPRNDVEKWYQIADLFVLPSHSEGSPNTLLEAMSSGMAVIGSRIPAIEYIVEHEANGYLVPVNDVRMLASAINRVFSHPEESAQIGARARTHVLERFSIDSVVEKYDKLYRSL